MIAIRLLTCASLLAALALPLPTLEASSAPLDVRLRPVRSEILIVEAGEPAAAIIAPEDDDYLRVAQRLAQSIAELTGAHLSILRGADLISPETRLLRPEWTDSDLILLGAFYNNPVLGLLYADYLDPTDAYYPGPGGHALRTVPAAFGPGVVVVLGASDLQGAGAAASSFLRQLSWDPEHRRLTAPRLLEVHATGTCAEQLAAARAELPEDWQGYVDARFRFGEPGFVNFGMGEGVASRRAWYGNAWAFVGSLGLNYQLTGDERYAQAAAHGVRRLLDIEDPFGGQPARYGGECFYDYQIPLFLAGWEVIDDSPWLTPEERDQAVRRVAELLRDSMGMYFYMAWASDRSSRLWPTSRHQIAAMWMYDRAQRYLRRKTYYPYSSEMAALVAQWEADSAAYFHISSHTPYYDDDFSAADQAAMLARQALASGDHTYFDTGALRQAADLMLLYGYDAMGGARGYELLFRFADYVYGGNAYSTFFPHRPSPLALAEGAQFPLLGMNLRGCYWVKFPALLDPRTGRTLGDDPVAIAPYPKLLYDNMHRGAYYFHRDLVRNTSLPLDDMFFKLGLRAGDGPRAQALLLQGAAAPAARPVVNVGAILAYHEAGHTFLTFNPAGGAEVSNLRISRGREREQVGYAAALRSAVDMPRHALIAAEMPDYHGADWVRTILWEKDGFFAVLDTVTARHDGEFHLATEWATHASDTVVSDGGARVRRGQAVFAVQNADGARTSAHAMGFRQERWIELQAGQRYHFLNLLSVDQPGRRQAYHIAPTGLTSLLVRGEREGQPVLALVGVSGADLPGLRVCAAGFRISRDIIFLASVRELTLGGASLLRASHPVHIEVELPSGRARVRAEAPGALSLGGEERRYGAGDTVLLLPQAAQWRRAIADALAALPTAPRQPDQPGPAEGGTRELASLDLPSLLGQEVGVSAWTPARIAGREALVAALTTGEVIAAHPARPPQPAQLLWRRSPGAPVSSVWAGDLDGDGSHDIALGLNQEVVLLDEAGREQWRRDLGSLWAITALTAEDLDGDGVSEIIGGYYKFHFCLNRDGTVRWHKFGYAGAATRIGAHDFDRSGVKEVVGGNVFATLNVFWDHEEEGIRAEGFSWTDRMSEFFFRDVDGDGYDDILFASNERLAAYSPMRRRFVWVWLTDSPLQGLLVTDLSTRPALLSVSDSGFLYRFDLQGRIEGALSIRERVTALAFTSAHDPRLWLACADATLRVYTPEGVLRAALRLPRPAQALVAHGPGHTVVAHLPNGFLWLELE